MTSIVRRLTVNRDRRAAKKAAYQKWLADFRDATLINTYKSAGLVVPAGLSSTETFRPAQRRLETTTLEDGSVVETGYNWFERRDNKWHRL